MHRYDPAEMAETEKWIQTLFEPVRLAFFNGPQPPPMQFLMTDAATPADAEVAVMAGVHQGKGGAFKLIYLFRRLRCVHVYECISHGRQWWYMLHLSTDFRFALRELQPATEDREKPYPPWWERGAGRPYPFGVVNVVNNGYGGSTSVVIRRDAAHGENWSGGVETLVPARLLFGVLPQCLLEQYRFWQDESLAPPGAVRPMAGYRRLRGYGLDSEDDTIIIVELTRVGEWDEVARRRMDDGGLVEATLLPGRVVSVTRHSKAAYKARFEAEATIATALEAAGLTFSRRKKAASGSAEMANEKDDDVDEHFDALVDMDDDGGYVVGARLEHKYDGEWVPCVVSNVGKDANGQHTGLYDIQYVNTKYYDNNAELGGKADIEHDDLQPRNTDWNRQNGEGIWHWEGMSDSEDEYW